jgi:hypothetical protein
MAFATERDMAQLFLGEGGKITLCSMYPRFDLHSVTAARMFSTTVDDLEPQ